MFFSNIIIYNSLTISLTILQVLLQELLFLILLNFGVTKVDREEQLQCSYICMFCKCGHNRNSLLLL